MTRKLLITLDEESEKALETLVSVRGGTVNRSKIIRELIIAKATGNAAATNDRAMLACVRKIERDTQVALGVLNSIALGFPTLSDAAYKDPLIHKHNILRGAEMTENAKIRKRIQIQNFNRNGDAVHE